jgi:hypothetical protein
LSAPPGIEFIFYGIVAGFGLAAAAIAYVVALGLRKLLKVSLGIREIAVMAGLFLILFFASSLFLGRTEEGVTLYIYGYPTGYRGTLLYYGFPRIMYSRFEPVAPTARSLFTGLSNFFVDGFFVDFASWAIVSVVLVYSVKYLATKRGRRPTPSV